MARSTVGKLASKTAAAAKRVTAGATKKANPGTKSPAKSPAKKSPAKKSPAGTAPKSTATVKKTTAPVKTASKATPAKKASADKAPAKKTAAKKTAAKKAPAKQTAKKTPAKRTPAKKTPAKKATTQKSAQKSPTKKASPVTKSTAKKTPAKKTAVKKAPVKKAPAKKAPAKKSAKPTTTAHARTLAVKADEDPWTPGELQEVRTELTAEADRLRGELDLAERELDDLMRDAGDGAGNDQADVGSTTFERDHEMSLANNARVMLGQVEHALGRIDDGTYGRCESCGQPIGKNRLMAFPRATLCLPCKQREERR